MAAWFSTKHDGHWEHGRELAPSKWLGALLESAKMHGYANQCQDCYSGNYNYLLSTRDTQVTDIITQFGYVFVYTIPVFWQHKLSRIIILARTSCCFLRLLNSSVPMPGLHKWPFTPSPLKNPSFTWKPWMELCILFPNLVAHTKDVNHQFKEFREWCSGLEPRNQALRVLSGSWLPGRNEHYQAEPALSPLSSESLPELWLPKLLVPLCEFKALLLQEPSYNRELPALPQFSGEPVSQ